MTSYCMQFTFAKKSLNFIYAFKCYQQIAINVGLSWPHFSWPTLYTRPVLMGRMHWPLTSLSSGTILLNLILLLLRLCLIKLTCTLGSSVHVKLFYRIVSYPTIGGATPKFLGGPNLRPTTDVLQAIYMA